MISRDRRGNSDSNRPKVGALLWGVGLLNPVTAVIVTLGVAADVFSLEKG